jgi:hypothetical protein
MKTIKIDQCHRCQTGTLTIDASTAGFKPGEWPEAIRIENQDGTETTFTKQLVDQMGGSYTSLEGDLLMVWND